MRIIPEILVLDDEPIVCDRIQRYLSKRGMNVETFCVSAEALKRIREKPFDVVVTDLKMESPTGMDVLRTIKEAGYKTEVIIITGYATFEKSREAEFVGAFDFIAKPFALNDIGKLVEKAARKAQKGK